eukprot:3709697-Rhodomonas_salina.2
MMQSFVLFSFDFAAVYCTAKSTLIQHNPVQRVPGMRCLAFDFAAVCYTAKSSSTKHNLSTVCTRTAFSYWISRRYARGRTCLRRKKHCAMPVSYTHLTLPTICSV